MDSERVFYAIGTVPPVDFSLSKLEGLCRKLASAWGEKR